MAGVPDVVGHDAVLAQVRDALARDRLHHALLLEGPPGVGKRTVATWIVLAANCTADGPRPCGRCGECTKVLAGTHPDVVVLVPDPEKASGTIPVADVREVVRTAGYHRFSARHRFVVVDPAEALQPAAANALLKTLEEPPAGTHFLLLARHSGALLPTIVSRCQRLRLAPVPEDVLAPWLAARGVEEPVRLARVAQGCPGRALTLADGGLAARTELRGRLLAALGGDLQGVFSFSESLSQGKRQEWMPQVETVLEILEELLRDVVVCAAGGDRALVHEDVRPLVEAWTDALWPSGVQRCERALQEVRADLAANVSGRTALDALFTRIATELGQARKAG